MKKDFNNNATDKQRFDVKGAILGVVAPAPDLSGITGSVSMKKDQRANETGQVISQAASLNVPSWAPQMSRRDEQSKDGFKLGERGVIAGTFNRCLTDPPFITRKDKLDDFATYRPKPVLARDNQPRPGF